MAAISAPETIVVTDYEFVFLGGKLNHTIGPDDSYAELEDRYILAWPAASEVAEIFKVHVLQKGTRVRVITKTEESAVDKIVRELKAKEAKDQGVTG